MLIKENKIIKIIKFKKWIMLKKMEIKEDWLFE